jgi:hypothetical protein
MSTPPPPDPAPRLRAVSEVTARPVVWLWPHHLGLGKLAVLEGDPGLSKTFVALDFCARLSTGRPWPDDSPGPAAAASIFLNGEDDVGDTLRPRLEALGADLTRVFVVEHGDGDGAVPLSLPGQTRALEALVARVAARLLVIDPVSAFFGPGVNTSSDAAIRRALRPLADLARRQACAVLLHRHLTKHGRGRAIHRGLGSIGLAGTCRSGWLVAEEAEGSDRRVLAQVKNNLAGRQPSLAFEVSQPDGAAPTLRWLGPVAVTADELQARPRRPGREAEALASATAFLAEVLADGPLSVRDIWDRAQGHGLSRRTLGRAKDEMGVRLMLVREDGRTVGYWLLPQHEAPPVDPAADDENSVEPWLEAQRRRFPGPCPLDDL